MNANLATYYKEAKFVYYKLDEGTLDKYSFIKETLDNELESYANLKCDYDVLIGYKNQGLDCENVLMVKETKENVTGENYL